ncbi:hypothetical protein TKK_0008117 [Trichogramma kaykai]
MLISHIFLLCSFIFSQSVHVRAEEEIHCLGISMKVYEDIKSFFHNILGKKTEKEDIRFYFASRNHPEYVTYNYGDELDLDAVHFAMHRDTYVIIHGFLSKGTENWVRNMKDALLKYNDANVIVVDWEKDSNTWNYADAVEHAKVVGKAVAEFLATVRHQAAVDDNDTIHVKGKLTIIGHSLGAHISGRAAHLLKKLPKTWRVSRIVGLDPAQPCYRLKNLEYRLDKSHANYVDIIHTNAAPLQKAGLGLPEAIGHVDFYPNGGSFQPGCVKMATIFDEAKCSHGRSHEIFTASILAAVEKTCEFQAYKWNLKIDDLDNVIQQRNSLYKAAIMGIESTKNPPSVVGTYFVPTGSEPPYCNVGNKQMAEIIDEIKSGVLE